MKKRLPYLLLQPFRHAFFFVNLLAFSFTSLPATAQLLPIRNYSTREGLNTNSIGALLRDSRGILWVGTYNGVNWYDGARFIQPEMHTRSGQIYVTNFLEDRGNRVWVTSWYSGIYKYDDGRFTNYLIDTVHLESQSNSVFDLLQLDTAHYLVATDRNAWIFSDSLSIAPGSANPGASYSFTLFDPANPALDRQINTLAMTRQQDILIGYPGGAAWYRHQPAGWSYAGMLWKDTSVSRIWIKDDQCWLATAKGLYYYPQLSAATSHLTSSQPILLSPGTPVEHVFIDKDNNTWFTTGNGAAKITGDPLHGRLQSYTRSNGLPSAMVTSILTDKEGITWLGSEDGLSRLNKEYYRFYPLAATIISLNTDRQGRLWMGSYDGLFQMQGRQATAINHIGPKRLGFVFCLLKDSMQDLWACSDAGILRIIDGRPVQQAPYVAFCAARGHDGSLWFGGRDGQIYHQSQTGGIREVPNPARIDERITAIYSDSRGFLWVGYGLTGLKKFRNTPGGLQLVKEYSSRTGYSNMRIRSLGDDGHGHLLVGTRTNGLYVFSTDAPVNPLIHLTTAEGLSGNWIKAFVAADAGVFLATNNGLDFADFSKLELPAPGAADRPNPGRNPGIHPIPFRNEQVPTELNAVFLQPDTIWLGTAKGVLQYIPRRQEKNATPPPAYLMKVTINGRTDSSFRPFTAEASLPDLSWRLNNIAFDFAGLSFRAEENVRYRYQMIGLDKEWSPVTDRRYVNYSNLSPGDYRFRVIAGNDDGVWSTTAATLFFHITTPFWLSGWFIALCGLLLAGMLYSFYRYRLRQALQIERLRTRISTDLHDDIGSTLSSISIMSDMILQENKGGPPDAMAREIKENSLSLMDKMDDIVWSINPRNDTLENLMARIQRFAAQLFEAKGIDYEIVIGNNIRRLRLPMEHRQNIYLIMKEAINNLVKYAEANRAVIRAASVDHTLRVEISDDGRGFAFPDNNSGNGIANMKSRATLMKANLGIHSTPGQGTTVILSLKIK